MISLPGKAGDLFAERINGLYRGLKGIAKMLNIHIVILIQRNDEWKARVRTGGSMRPMLGDAYGGGSIKQNLDVWFSIYRPEPLLKELIPSLPPEREKEGQLTRRQKMIQDYEKSRGKAWIINHKRRRGEPGTSQLSSRGSRRRCPTWRLHLKDLRVSHDKLPPRLQHHVDKRALSSAVQAPRGLRLEIRAEGWRPVECDTVSQAIEAAKECVKCILNPPIRAEQAEIVKDVLGVDAWHRERAAQAVRDQQAVFGAVIVKGRQVKVERRHRPFRGQELANA